MTNEYVSRYQGMSHQQLYQAVQSGNPDQIDGQAAGWKTLSTTTRQVADDLSADLASLGQGWGGPAGQEYNRRLALVSAFALNLSDDQSVVKLGLDSLSGQLKEAKKKAESPESVDDNDKMLKGAATGAGAGILLPPVMLASTVVGAAYGHEQDEAEKKASKERMVQLVASLAADFDLAKQDLKLPTAPSADLPGTDPTGTVDPKATGTTTNPRGMTSTGTVYTSTSVANPGPTHGTSAFVATGGPGGDPGPTGTSSLLGVDGGSVTAVAAAAAAGAGVVVARQVPLGATGVGGAGLAGGMPAGGVLASASPNSPRISVGGPSAVGAAGRAPVAGSASTLTTSQAGSGRSGGMVGRGGALGDDEIDEHSSWLTEDEMVWGNDQDIAPSVLGRQPSAE